jgi:hypothetical protein
MGFVLEHSAVNYLDGLAATKSVGNCMGQCCLWAMELISGNIQSLVQPCISAGGALHREYINTTAHAKFYQDGDVRFWRSLEGRVPKNINCKIAKNRNKAEKLLGSLENFSGNAVIVMGWEIENTAHCLSSLGVFNAQGGHALAALKLKHNGSVYLYDPNYGVYQWCRSPGASLMFEIQQFIRDKDYGMAAQLDGAMMMSTNEHIAANNEHVYI